MNDNDAALNVPSTYHVFSLVDIAAWLVMKKSMYQQQVPGVIIYDCMYVDSIAIENES